MASPDLERVQSDLAAMKIACVEPAIPTEEITPNLILAGCGLLLAVAGYFLPTNWMVAGISAAAVAGIAAYVPWKWRVFREDYPRRRLEAKEAWASGIGGLALLAYVIWFRFAVADSRESLKTTFAGLLFLIGVTIAAYCIVETRRRFYLGTGIAAAIGGLLMNLATSPPALYCVAFGMLAAVGLSNAICLSWFARKQRGEHVSH